MATRLYSSKELYKGSFEGGKSPKWASFLVRSKTKDMQQKQRYYSQLDQQLMMLTAAAFFCNQAESSIHLLHLVDSWRGLARCKAVCYWPSPPKKLIAHQTWAVTPFVSNTLWILYISFTTAGLDARTCALQLDSASLVGEAFCKKQPFRRLSLPCCVG